MSGSEPGKSTDLPAPQAQALELRLTWRTRNEDQELHMRNVFWPQSPSWRTAPICSGLSPATPSKGLDTTLSQQPLDSLQHAGALAGLG